MAKEIALRQLTTRARSRAELSRTLAGKNVPADVVDEVLDRLEAVHLLDDQAFAQQVASARRRQQKSRFVIARELQDKGLAAEVIDETLSGISAEDELQAAVEFARKRSPGLAGLAAPVQHRRLAGSLSRRGFPAQTVAAAVRNVMAEIDTNDGCDKPDYPECG